MSTVQNLLDAAEEIKRLETALQQLQDRTIGLCRELEDTKANRDKWQRRAEAVRLDPLEKENDSLKLKVMSLEKELETKGNASTRLFQEKDEWKDLAENRQKQMVLAGEGHAQAIDLLNSQIRRLEKKLQEKRAVSMGDEEFDDFFKTTAQRMYNIASNHGFHEGDEKFVTLEQLVKARVGEWVSNLHGEVSEFWEAYRKDMWHKPCDKAINGVPIGLTCFEEELADGMIRHMDVSMALGVNIGRAIRIKSEYNRTRPYRHGNKLA